MKNEVDIYGAPVFAPDYSATVLAAKMCTNANEHSMDIRYLWAYTTKHYGFVMYVLLSKLV
jgi:hypothetical protein